MANGDVQVDSVTGYPMVDSTTGYPLVTGASNTCCCGPGNICFQPWTSTFDCNTSTWGAPVANPSVCLPPTTSEAWVVTGCTAQKYVPFTTLTTCTVDANCSAANPTSSPGVPPLGFPGNCCGCVDCPDATPAKILATLSAVRACTECFQANMLVNSANINQSFCLPQCSPCIWGAVFPFTVDIRFYCANNGCSGPIDCYYTDLWLQLTRVPGGWSFEGWVCINGSVACGSKGMTCCGARALGAVQIFNVNFVAQTNCATSFSATNGIPCAAAPLGGGSVTITPGGC